MKSEAVVEAGAEQAKWGPTKMFFLPELRTLLSYLSPTLGR